MVQRHKMKRDKPQRPKLPQFLYSWVSAIFFTLFQFYTKLVPLPFQHFFASILFSLCNCAFTLFFYLLFLVLSTIKSSNQASSFSSYMLHTSHSTALLSHFSVSHHPQTIQFRSHHLLTHLRGAQLQIFNYGEGKLYPFHPSLKSLNVFSFWIDFSIL